MTKDVFISYKAEEFDEANFVKTALETNGISCWMAPMCIPGGSNYAVEIPQAIRGCKVFVLILSERSQLSKWVPRELDQAINMGKTVLPFMLEDCPLKDDFNFYLTNVQRYAAYENKSRAIEKMLTEIKAIISAKENEAHDDAVDQISVAEDGVSYDGTHVVSDNAEVASESAKTTAEESEATDEAPDIFETLLEKRQDELHRERQTRDTEKQKKSAKKENVKKLVNEKKADVKAPRKKGKFLRILALIAAVIVGIIIISFITKTVNTVEIAGKEFEKSDSYISLSDATITERDLPSFEKFERISSVNLYGCSITPHVLGEVSKYVSYGIVLENCSITDEHMRKLGEVDPDLSYLTINGNENISDISVLAPLADTIREISFSDCSVEDVSVLAQFTKLTKIEANNNKISDISSFSILSDLAVLEVANNNIEDISSLKLHKKLLRVNVSDNNLESLDGLTSAISLEVLYAENNKITTLSGLENTTVLMIVDVSGNSISDASILAKSKETLIELDLEGNPLYDTDFISELVNIQVLNLDKTGISDISGVAKLSKLKDFSASGNVIKSVSGIFKGGELEYLDLSDNNITTFDGFSVNEEYYGGVLDLHGNELSGTLSLPGGRYSIVDLGGNSITKIEGAEGIKISTIVIQYSEGFDFESLKDKGIQRCYILDCPLDKELAVSDTLPLISVKFIDRDGFVSDYYDE